jgi:hypothetical protein
MIRTQVQFTEDQMRALKELSYQEHISIAELTRQALDYWLQNRQALPDAETRRRARAVVGRFHSGRMDVSERHDEHLAEVYSTWTSS